MKVTKLLCCVLTIFSANTLIGQTVELEKKFPLQKASKGVVERMFIHSELVENRAIDVWLPDGYNKNEKYSVIYMHDGQMLFDASVAWNKQEWKVDETVNQLIATKQIKDCIVVGISNVAEKRYTDYFPQKVVNLLGDSVLNTMKERLNGNEFNADNYLKYIVTVVKPAIDKRYNTKVDAENTIIMGSSMGGLISIYALCEYPEVFGGAGCISIHSPMATTDVDVENNILATKFREYLINNLPKANSKYIYMDYGDQTLDAFYKPYQDKIDAVMQVKGWKQPYWETKFFPGAGHTEDAWAARLSIPLLFLFSR